MEKDIKYLIALGFLLVVVFGLFVVVFQGIIFNRVNYNIQAAHNDIEFEETYTDLIVKNVETMKVNGISMQPTLFTGNRLILKKFSGGISDLREGQIVWVETQPEGWIHRIKGIYPEYILTQGDNSPIADAKIQANQIKYIIVGVLYE